MPYNYYFTPKSFSKKSKNVLNGEPTIGLTHHKTTQETQRNTMPVLHLLLGSGY